MGIAQAQQPNNDEVDLNQIFRIIKKYNISIILIVLLFFIGSAIFAYYKQNVYISHATIEILVDNKNISSSAKDFIKKAFGGSIDNIHNEKEILQSRYIFEKAIQQLNLSVRYYDYNKLNKKTELYKKTPFIISAATVANPIYSKTFELIPIDNNSFQLIIKPLSPFSIKGILSKIGIRQLKKNEKIAYKGVHRFNEKIITPWFSFTVNKIATLNAKKYTFNFIHKEALYDVFYKGLSISLYSKSSSIIGLNYQDSVSLRAANILNAIIQTYINESIKEKAKTAKLILGFINSQLDKINAKLTETETNLKNYKIKNNVINLQNKLTLDTEKIASYDAKQQKVQTEINILTNLQHYIDKNSDLSGLTIGTIYFVDKNLASLVQKLQNMIAKKNLMLVDYTEAHPEIIKIKKNITDIKNAIKLALSNSLKQLKQRNNDLKKIIAKYNLSLKSLPEKEKILAELSRPLKVNESVYQYLLQKKAETAIIKSSTIANARVLDAAREELNPTKSKGKLIIIVGIVFGFILGIAQSFLREFLASSIQSANEIKSYTSLPLYGIIPFNKNRVTKSFYIEAIKNLKTNLHLLSGNDKYKIISITSSVSGEGKVTIASSLAKVLVKGDKKVVLVDLDLYIRRTSIHKKFKLNNDIGATSYLTKKNTLEEITKETDISGLYVITTGKLPPNPSELILSDIFEKFLKELSEKYDYIIINTAPAGLVSDALIIMNYPDITFFIIRANYTKKEFVKNIDKIAKEYSHNKIGLILNAATIGEGDGYGYGVGYTYNYRHKHNGITNKVKTVLAIVGVIIIVAVVFRNTLKPKKTDNLSQVALPTKSQTVSAKKEVNVTVEKTQNNDNLDNITQKLKQENLSKTEIINKQVAITVKESMEKITKKAISKQKISKASKSPAIYIQVSSFSKYAPSEKFLKSITDRGYSYIYHKTARGKKSLTKVLIGPFYSKKEARNTCTDVKNNIETGAFLVEF